MLGSCVAQAMPLPFAGLQGSTTHGHTADYGAMRDADEAEALQYDVGKVGSMLQQWRDYAAVKRDLAEDNLASVSHEEEERAAKSPKSQQSPYVADRAHTTHLDLYDEMPMTIAAEDMPEKINDPLRGKYGEPIPDMHNYYTLLGCSESVREAHLNGCVTYFNKVYGSEVIERLCHPKIEKNAYLRHRLKHRQRDYIQLARKAGQILLDPNTKAAYDSKLRHPPPPESILPYWMRSLPMLREEGWAWCWQQLWKQHAPEHQRLVCNVVETAIIVNGVVSRVFFTTNEGLVKTKSSKHLRRDHVHKEFLRWHKSLPVKGIKRSSEATEMASQLLDEADLDRVLRGIEPAQALQRFIEPVQGTFRNTLTKEEGFNGIKFQTERVAVIGCDIKGGAKHAICEELMRSNDVHLNMQLDLVTQRIVDQIEKKAQCSVCHLTCEYVVDAEGRPWLQQLLHCWCCDPVEVEQEWREEKDDWYENKDMWQSHLRQETERQVRPQIGRAEQKKLKRAKSVMQKKKDKLRESGTLMRPVTCEPPTSQRNDRGVSYPQGTYGTSWWQSPMPSLQLLSSERVDRSDVAAERRDRIKRAQTPDPKRDRAPALVSPIHPLGPLDGRRKGDREFFLAMNQGHFSQLAREKPFIAAEGKEKGTRRYTNSLPMQRTSFFGGNPGSEPLPQQLGELRPARRPRGRDVAEDLNDPMSGSWNQDFALAATGVTEVETAIAEREKEKRMVELGAERSLVVERDAKGRVVKSGGGHFAAPK